MTIQQMLLGLGGAGKVGWIMTLTHDGHANADWKHSNRQNGPNTQSKNCYKGTTGDDSNGIWFTLGSEQSPLTWNGSVDHINGCSNVFKIDADGGITANCAIGGGGWNYEKGALFVNTNEKMVVQRNYHAACLSLSGTTFSHHWTVGNGAPAQGHSNAPHPYPNENTGYSSQIDVTWMWTDTDKLWYGMNNDQQQNGQYYGDTGFIPVNVSTGAWDTNYSSGGNYVANYHAIGVRCAQRVNNRMYVLIPGWRMYRNQYQAMALFRWDDDGTTYSNAFTDPSNDLEYKKMFTYAAGNWSYSNTTYDSEYLHMWVHDTGSDEKIYLGGQATKYSNENSTSCAGSLNTQERNCVMKMSSGTTNTADWLSNLDGGSSSNLMDAANFDSHSYGGVKSVRPDGNGNCISVHLARNHVVSNNVEIIIAKWNDTTGALISTYGIACITTNEKFKEDAFCEMFGCLTTDKAVYMVAWTEGHKPVIMKLPHDIGSLAGNHTVGGLTFTIGAATGVSQGSLTKNRKGWVDDGYNLLTNTSYDNSQDNLLSEGGNSGYGFSSGHPSTTRSHIEI